MSDKSDKVVRIPLADLAKAIKSEIDAFADKLVELKKRETLSKANFQGDSSTGFGIHPDFTVEEGKQGEQPVGSGLDQPSPWGQCALCGGPDVPARCACVDGSGDGRMATLPVRKDMDDMSATGQSMGGDLAMSEDKPMMEGRPKNPKTGDEFKAGALKTKVTYHEDHPHGHYHAEDHGANVRGVFFTGKGKRKAQYIATASGPGDEGTKRRIENHAKDYKADKSERIEVQDPSPGVMPDDKKPVDKWGDGSGEDAVINAKKAEVEMNKGEKLNWKESEGGHIADHPSNPVHYDVRHTKHGYSSRVISSQADKHLGFAPDLNGAKAFAQKHFEGTKVKKAEGDMNKDEDMQAINALRPHAKKTRAWAKVHAPEAEHAIRHLDDKFGHNELIGSLINRSQNKKMGKAEVPMAKPPGGNSTKLPMSKPMAMKGEDRLAALDKRAMDEMKAPKMEKIEPTKTEQAHKAGKHETDPKRNCKLCWEVAHEAQRKISAPKVEKEEEPMENGDLDKGMSDGGMTAKAEPESKPGEVGAPNPKWDAVEREYYAHKLRLGATPEQTAYYHARRSKPSPPPEPTAKAEDCLKWESSPKAYNKGKHTAESGKHRMEISKSADGHVLMVHDRHSSELKHTSKHKTVEDAKKSAEDMEKSESGLDCPLCHEKHKDLKSHLDNAHEFEMEGRHKNPDDPVVSELRQKGVLPAKGSAEDMEKSDAVHPSELRACNDCGKRFPRGSAMKVDTETSGVHIGDNWYPKGSIEYHKHVAHGGAMELGRKK